MNTTGAASENLRSFTSGTLIVTINIGLRTLTQVLIFLMITQMLGASDYGAFITTLALASLIGNFSGFGSQTLLVQQTAIDRGNFKSAWDNTLSSVFYSAPILFALYLVVTLAILPESISFEVIMLIGASEILIAPLLLVVIATYQAHEEMTEVGRYMLLPSLIRLLTILIAFTLPGLPTNSNWLNFWAYTYFVTGFLVTLYAFRKAMTYYDTSIDLKEIVNRSPTFAGAPFAASNLILKAYTDADKIMIANLSSLHYAGIFSTAHRFIDMANIPVNSFLITAMPSFFRSGGKLDNNIAQRLLRASLPSFLYSIFISIVLYLSSDLITSFLSNEFTEVSDIIKWIAWLPIIMLPRNILQRMLLSSERKSTALKSLGTGAGINLLLNFLLIPMYGISGAIIATYIAEVLTLTLMLISIYQLQNKRNHNEQLL